MGKKKSDAGAKRPADGSRAKPGPKPKAGGALPNVVSMRGTPEWREWLGRLAEKCRATPSGLIDRALAELAKREGFEDPPRRI